MVKIVLLGVGQSFRGDDGIGILAVEHWQEAYPETAELLDLRVETLELPGLALLDALAGAEKAILVDAVQSENPVGTLHWLTEKELLSFSPDSQSAHGWGVAETLKLGRQLGREDMPDVIMVLGVEAEQFEIGAGLSESIRKRLPKILKVIQRNVSEMISPSTR